MSDLTARKRSRKGVPTFSVPLAWRGQRRHRNATRPPKKARQKWLKPDEGPRMKRIGRSKPGGPSERWIENWLIPPSTARAISNNNFAAALIEALGTLVSTRDSWLEGVEREGLVLKSMGDFLIRFPKTKGKDNKRLPPVMQTAAEMFPRRRLDFVVSIVRVACVLVARSNHKTGEILSARKHHAKREPMGIEEISEESEVCKRTVNDVLRVFRRARWINFTKHRRDKKNGKVVNARTSVRRLNLSLIANQFGPGFATMLGFAAKKAEERDREETRAEEERIAAARIKARKDRHMPGDLPPLVQSAIAMALKKDRVPFVAPPPVRTPYDDLPAAERKKRCEAVAAECPDLRMLADIVDEARRRYDGPPEASGPPEPETSGEPS